MHKFVFQYSLSQTFRIRNDNSVIHLLRFRFVCFFAYRPCKHIFSHVGTEPTLPGNYQYFWGVNVSCSRTQHGDLSEDRTPDLSLRSSTTRPPHLLALLAHLSRRLKGELIVYRSIRRPCVR